MRGYDLLQLDDRQILPVLSAVPEALVIFFHGLVNGLKLICRGLYLFDIIIGYVIPGPEIFTDDPLYQSFRNFSDPIIHQSEKISRRDIFPVKLQAYLK